MKILMVISQFHPIIGGAERQAQLLAQKLIEKGVQVEVVTGWWKWRTPRREMINGVPVFRNFSFWGMFGIKGLRPLGALTYMITLAIHLFLHRAKYDIIHVHQILYPAFVSVFIGGGILKKPVLAKIGCTGITSDVKNINRFPWGNLQLKYILRHLDSLIATNEEGMREFQAIKYPEYKIVNIPNGVSIALPKKTESKEMLYAISAVRLDYQKGIDILLNSFKEVLEREKTIRLVILGRGPIEWELKKLANSLGIAGSVEFLGLVDDPENYLKNSDIFILPSRAEGMSNALLEAMCIGLSCIATNISGNRELISDKENDSVPIGGYLIRDRGILVNPDDVGGLAEAILYLVRNEKTREELGRRARKFIQENYSIDMIADKYITLYQRILNKESQCAESVEK